MKRNIFTLGPVLLMTALLTGCNQGNERLVERSGLEGKAAAEAQASVEKDILEKRVIEMEADLSRQHNFYQALKGTYEGTIETEQGVFSVRFTLVPSIAPYSGSRLRTVDEVTNDINALSFNIQALQWNPANRLSSVGCRVEGIKADIRNGEVSVASENCPNVYLIQIGPSSPPDQRNRYQLIEDIDSGNLASVSSIQGVIQPTTNASIYEFKATRAERRK